MAKNIDSYTESVLQGVVDRTRAGDYVSDTEREAIIQSIISTQRIEGIEMSYEMVAEVVDEVLAEPLPTLE